MTTVQRRPLSGETQSRAPFLKRASNGTLYLAALTASWTTVAVGGNNLIDYLLVLALLVLVAARLAGQRRIFVSGWMLLPPLASILITTWAVVSGVSNSPDTTMQIRVILSTTVVAVLLTSAGADGGAPLLQRLLRLWAVGIAISAAVAILTSFGFVDPSEFFVQKSGERLSGLTSHPNALAFSLVMGIPAAAYLVGVARSFWRSVGWFAALAVIVWGLVLTGSRAGLLVGLPVLALAVAIWLRASRARIMMVPIMILLGVTVALVLPGLLADTRLVQGAEDSDSGRIQINEAAMQWFYDSPFFGGGFGVMHGVAVPIMVLSGGGIVLAVGYYLFVFRSVPVLWSGRSKNIALMGMLSLAAFLVFGVLNPVWMERITYWPPLIAALVVLLRRPGDDSANPWGRKREVRVPTRRGEHQARPW